MLLEQGQFDACRMVTEKMIVDLMAPPTVEADLPGDALLQRWLTRDLELACLHVIHSKCLWGLHQYETAAQQAGAAALLARKAGDVEIYADAVHSAGVCHLQAGNYPMAVQVLTRCLDQATDLLRAKALFNRGHTYERMAAYKFAAADYEAGLQMTEGQDENLARRCRMNLAWMLVLLKDFSRAEEVLEFLALQPGAESDQLLQAQLAHDRLHMEYLRGNLKAALKGAVNALKACGDQYPHVRAHIALTIMAMTTDGRLPEQAVIFGLLAKRLAGQARRADLDEVAGRRLQMLEIEAGTECFVQALHRVGQVAPGAVSLRRGARRG